MVFIGKFGTNYEVGYYNIDGTHGLGEPDLSNNPIVLCTDEVIFKKYNGAKYLSSVLGLPECIGLYEVFSFFFDSQEISDWGMVRVLFDGFLVNNERTYYCLNIGNTFSWFYVDNGLKLLGSYQLSFSISKYSAGKFVKQLRYKMVDTGVKLSNVKYLCWDTDDCVNKLGWYFEGLTFMSEMFERVDSFKGMKLVSIMSLLTNDLEQKVQNTAISLVQCLNSNYNSLGIYEKDAQLFMKNVYYKDYTTCTLNLINKKNLKYFIILDCEGTSSGVIQDGCSSIGGLICCRHESVLVNVDNFISDYRLIVETFERVIQNFRDVSGRKHIDVLTFGMQDRQMLTAEFNKVKSNSLSQISFVDVRRMLLEVIGDFGSLKKLAETLGVKVVMPIHNPLNDAKTLFNVLAKLYSTGQLK